MEYDHGDSFLFQFEPNGIQFGSKPKGKRSPHAIYRRKGVLYRHWKVKNSAIEVQVMSLGKLPLVGCTSTSLYTSSCTSLYKHNLHIIIQFLLFKFGIDIFDSLKTMRFFS